jgi:ice-binding like protein
MFTLPRLTARLAVVASFGALLVTARDSAAQSGGAAVLNFAILGGPAVTCTRSTTAGDVGVASTTAFTNTGCTITGNIHAGDALAAQAYNEYLNAYNNIAATSCSGPVLTGTLAGRTLAPGVYCVSAEAKTGVLTLNGPATGSWTFKVTDGASTGAFTGTSFSVVLAGGAQACNVIWWSEAAATQTDSDLKGNILSGAAITLTRGSFVGRALAKAAVTLTDVRTISGCV